ncbi:MAG: hypothetical protein NZ553_10975 [Caldilinea sp.]|nr:hypothetical protein [Caldilinea sp.]MDW8440986.1 hypothetical protein [Caldilineaceae bacterium]
MTEIAQDLGKSEDATLFAEYAESAKRATLGETKRRTPTVRRSRCAHRR